MSWALDRIAEDAGAARGSDGEIRWGQASLRSAFDIAAMEDNAHLAQDILEHPLADFPFFLTSPEGGYNTIAEAARQGHWRFLDAVFETADPQSLDGRSLLSLALIDGCPLEAIEDILSRFPLMAETDWLNGADLIAQAVFGRCSSSVFRRLAIELDPIAEPSALREALRQAAEAASELAAASVPHNAIPQARRMIELIDLCFDQPENYWTAALSRRASAAGSIASCKALLDAGASPFALLDKDPPLTHAPSIFLDPRSRMTPIRLAIANSHFPAAALLAQSGAPVGTDIPYASSAAADLASACATDPKSARLQLLIEWARLDPEPSCSLRDGSIVPISQAFRDAVELSIRETASNSPLLLAQRKSHLESIAIDSLSWRASVDSQPKPRGM